MFELQSMSDPELEEIRIMDEIASGWEQVAFALKIDEEVIESLRKEEYDVKSACSQMFSRWISSHGTEVTWEVLTDALHRADYKDLAEKVKKFKKL